MTPYYVFQAKQVHKAVSGLGTDEDTLIEILGVHCNEEIQAICAAYESRKLIQEELNEVFIKLFNFSVRNFNGKRLES